MAIRHHVLVPLFIGVLALPSRATTHPVQGPSGFVAQKFVCASFESGNIRISQVVTERDIREYVTRLENGSQTYSYLMNEYCDAAEPIRELVKMTFMCCTMKVIVSNDKPEEMAHER